MVGGLTGVGTQQRLIATIAEAESVVPVGVITPDAVAR